jgi:hypothetical protein
MLTLSNPELQENHPAWKCRMLQNLEPVAKEKTVKESNMGTFCMKHAASDGNRKDVKTACAADPGCTWGHVMDFQELLASESTSVNVKEYEEDEDEEGCMNLTAARAEMLGEDGRRAPNSSWLDLKKEDDIKMYHFNVVKDN